MGFEPATLRFSSPMPADHTVSQVPDPLSDSVRWSDQLLRETSVREASAREVSVREASVREVSVREASVRETSVRETGVREASVRETGVREASVLHWFPLATDRIVGLNPKVDWDI